MPKVSTGAGKPGKPAKASFAHAGWLFLSASNRRRRQVRRMASFIADVRGHASSDQDPAFRMASALAQVGFPTPVDLADTNFDFDEIKTACGRTLSLIVKASRKAMTYRKSYVGDTYYILLQLYRTV
jgi:hypothetical protein